MKTLKITAKDVKESTSYRSDYIGEEDLSHFSGNVELDDNLGLVRFNSISVTGHLWAGLGTGIEVAYSITVGDSIKVGGSIEVGNSIWAGDSIWTGAGIIAGRSITCKQNLNVGYRIFAGTAIWEDTISDEDKTITCGKLEHGEIAYGILKETGLPDEESDIIELNGKKYREIKEEL